MKLASWNETGIAIWNFIVLLGFTYSREKIRILGNFVLMKSLPLGLD